MKEKGFVVALAGLILVGGVTSLYGQLAPTVAESNGIVAVEVERAPAHGGWQSRTNIAGYSGTAFYYMSGANSFNNPGLDLLEYPFVLSTAGVYQLQLRSRIADGTYHTEHNDTFVRLVNADGTAVAPVANNNTAHGTHWYKIYMNQLNAWVWDSSNRDHDPKSLAWNLPAGTYRFQLSKRSMGHAVDRFVLWNRALHSLANTSTGRSANNTALNNLANSPDDADVRNTVISIVGEEFHINGRPTYEGRTWQGHRIEGLLMNARLVQGIFDDLNPETVSLWNYPDGPWDADRNTSEFVAAMPSWRQNGLLCAVVNLQGGSPEGYSQSQPWHNSAILETLRL